MTIYLVRHASAGSRSLWAGPHDGRPLDLRGLSQAEGLTRMFADVRPARFVSSPARRCVETITPWADQAGRPVDVDERLQEGSPFEPVLAWLPALAGDGDAVLCSHGDLIPEVIAALRRRHQLADGPLPCQKASVWMLELRDGEVLGGSYLPPPPA